MVNERERDLAKGKAKAKVAVKVKAKEKLTSATLVTGSQLATPVRRSLTSVIIYQGETVIANTGPTATTSMRARKEERREAQIVNETKRRKQWEETTNLMTVMKTATKRASL